MPNKKSGTTRFDELLERLPRLLETLLAASPVHRKVPGEQLRLPEIVGVYLFTENDQHRYVGRTRNVRERLGQHTRPKSPENSAPFAFNIAKKKAEADGVSLSGPRKKIQNDPAFVPYFGAAKDRVRAMDYRFVDIDWPALSTVFEVYASVALGTDADFNLFETH